jgi:hypothetical protein
MGAAAKAVNYYKEFHLHDGFLLALFVLFG